MEFRFARHRWAAFATAAVVVALSVTAVHGGILADNSDQSPRKTIGIGAPLIPRLTTLWPPLPAHVFKYRQPSTPTAAPSNGDYVAQKTKPSSTNNKSRPEQQNAREPSKNRPQQQQPVSKPVTGNETSERVPSRTETTSKKPVKLETTTHDRSIITAPLITCPEGQRMSPDRRCEADVFVDPEGGD